MERWQRRDLSAKRYVYFWVDGIYFGASLEEEKQCILVIIGATDHGTKELIAIGGEVVEAQQGGADRTMAASLQYHPAA